MLSTGVHCGISHPSSLSHRKKSGKQHSSPHGCICSPPPTSGHPWVVSTVASLQAQGRALLAFGPLLLTRSLDKLQGCLFLQCHMGLMVTALQGCREVTEQHSITQLVQTKPLRAGGGTQGHARQQALSSAVLETALKLSLGGKQRVRGEYILIGGEEHERTLGATGRGTKEQADQQHGYGVNNGEFNLATTQQGHGLPSLLAYPK